MVNFHWRTDNLLVREAVAAAVAGLLYHQFPRGGRNVGGTQLTLWPY
jgi:hypothetical protein